MARPRLIHLWLFLIAIILIALFTLPGCSYLKKQTGDADAPAKLAEASGNIAVDVVSGNYGSAAFKVADLLGWIFFGGTALAARSRGKRIKELIATKTDPRQTRAGPQLASGAGT